MTDFRLFQTERLVSRGRQKVSVCGNGLRASHGGSMTVFDDLTTSPIRTLGILHPFFLFENFEESSRHEKADTVRPNNCYFCSVCGDSLMGLSSEKETLNNL